MHRDLVYRPEADEGKINSKDDFELCYLRHRYLRKAQYNPTESEMAPYSKILTYVAKNTIFRHQNLFRIVGLEYEDLINVCRVHLVSYLASFSLQADLDKLKEFIKVFKNEYGKKPNEVDLLQKNRANLTLFLKQRMEEMVRICRQKASNIQGVCAEEYYIFYGYKKPPRLHRLLLENHKKYEFKKMDPTHFRNLKKKANKKNSLCFRFEGIWYVAVPVEKRRLDIIDFAGANLNPYDNVHNMNPEQLCNKTEEENYWKNKQIDFDSQKRSKKINQLRDFIKENKTNDKFKQEIFTAKKILKDLISV